jgi:mannose-1-phosphate guanylyltransferase
MPPDQDTADYGWILPAAGDGPIRSVAAFVEKPGPSRAAMLRAQGAIWNSFLFAAGARALRDLIERHASGLVRELAGALALGGDAVDRLYDVVEPVDLSHDVFAKVAPALRVLRVPKCGWTDLGTPQRVRACLAQRPRPSAAAARSRPRLRLDLAAARTPVSA